MVSSGVYFFPMLSSYKIQIIFVVIGIFVGAFITSQLRTDAPVSSLFPADELEARSQVIKTFVDEQSQLQSNIVSLRKAIEDNQSKNEAASQASNLALLDDLKGRIGLTQQTGTGVEILLDDSPLARRENGETLNESLIHASDIRDIVNVLRAANAEAIAINSQRILATTPIASVGSSILVNNFYIVPPFTITATGDPEILIQRLLDMTALTDLYERKSKYNIQFSFKQNDGLVIPVYNGDFRLKYLTSSP